MSSRKLEDWKSDPAPCEPELQCHVQREWRSCPEVSPVAGEQSHHFY